MAPCRPFLFISFPRGFRLSSSNLGFFGCGVQLAPHSLSLVSEFPSFPVPHYSLLRIWKTIRGRLPQLHCLAAGVERMHEWVQSQTRSRRTSCLFGKHPPAPAGKRKPGPPPKPKRRSSFRVSASRTPSSETTNWPTQGRGPRPDRAIEKSLLRSRLSSCREAFSVLLSKGAAGRKLPARPTKSFSGGRWRALAKGTAWAA